MGKPSSNSQTLSDTPTRSLINSISSKTAGLATSEIPDTSTKLSLNLRPKAHLQSEHQYSRQINQNVSTTDDVLTKNGINPYTTLLDNQYTNGYNNKDLSPSHQYDTSRIPLPITEIEPHYSSDSYVSARGKKRNIQKGKHGNATDKIKQKGDIGNDFILL